MANGKHIKPLIPPVYPAPNEVENWHNRGNENSDIDIYVIVSGDECWNFKKYFSGVITEIYFCPAREWKRNMENGHATTLRAFSSGTVLFENDKEVSELIELGKQLWEKGPKPLTQLQIGNSRIKLTEYIQDIEGLPADSYQNKLLYGMVVPLALDAYCPLNQKWPEKTEKLIDCIGKYDTKLYQMALAFMRRKNLIPGKLLKLLIILLAHLEEDLLNMKARGLIAKTSCKYHYSQRDYA